MITQIYDIQSPEEALACIEAGADYIGVCPPQYTGHDETLPGVVSHETAKAIMAATEGKGAKRVYIILADDPETAYRTVEAYHPEVIHISATNFTATPQVVEKIKSIDPAVRVMQALAVDGPEAIQKAKEFAAFVDLLILDSPNPNVGCIGAAGVEHDRAVDRAIIEAVDIPVIIAGGLGPDNVEEAIRETNPWGVDSLTKTSRFFPDGTFEKDIELVRLFCQRAKAAQP